MDHKLYMFYPYIQIFNLLSINHFMIHTFNIIVIDIVFIVHLMKQSTILKIIMFIYIHQILHLIIYYLQF